MESVFAAMIRCDDGNFRGGVGRTDRATVAELARSYYLGRTTIFHTDACPMKLWEYGRGAVNKADALPVYIFFRMFAKWYFDLIKNILLVVGLFYVAEKTKPKSYN
ncbi:MAG TPA: hypothetical protein VGR91_19325 [Stellaceae bacterium]|nr:hypothetical protein [Stellaceae bacterium]